MVVVSAADCVHNRAKGVGETAMKHMTADFSRIIAGVRDGSQQAAGDLLAEYGDLVLRVVRRRLPQTLRRLFDSHDFAQVVWGSIFRHRSRLNRFNTADEFVAFAATVAANKVRMEVRRWLRQQKRNLNRDRPADEWGGDCQGSEPTPSQVAVAREVWFRLLEKQPLRYREIGRLRHSGQSTREIAARVGLDPGHVRRLLRTMFRDLAR
jgi:RNA polymerase sigma factor (sigma-70 family)